MKKDWWFRLGSVWIESHTYAKIPIHINWVTKTYGKISLFCFSGFTNITLTNQFWGWNSNAYLYISADCSRFWRYGIRFLFEDTIKIER